MNKNDAIKTCTNLDCPERTGGECTAPIMNSQIEEQTTGSHIVPTQKRTKPFLCRIGFHKWSRHFSTVQEYIKFFVCKGCGKWKHGRTPGL